MVLYDHELRSGKIISWVLRKEKTCYNTIDSKEDEINLYYLQAK